VCRTHAPIGLIGMSLTLLVCLHLRAVNDDLTSRNNSTSMTIRFSKNGTVTVQTGLSAGAEPRYTCNIDLGAA